MTRPEREVCYRCHKPAVVCVCADIPRVDNRTEVIILQHPRERFHPIGTVRFARLGLARARVLVRHPRERVEDPALLLGALPPERVGVLYPSRTSRLLSALTPEARPHALVVLDGTWHEAKALYRENPWLERLPGYHLAPEAPGRYRIRREPNDTALSTLEAIVGALRALEPETAGFDRLIAAFDRMIDRQVEYAAAPHPRAKHFKLKRPALPLPEVLRRGVERVVVAHGEQARAPGGGSGHALVQWTGVRLDTGEVFEALVRPEGLTVDWPSAQHLAHLGLDRATLAEGLAPAAVAAAWRAFVRDGEALAVWNQGALALAGPLLPDGLAPPLILKTLWANARRRRPGGLDEVLAVEGLTPTALAVRGRAATVLGGLSALALRLAELGASKGSPPA